MSDDEQTYFGKVFAAVVEGEGIVGVTIPGIGFMPAACAKMSTMEMFRPFLMDVAKQQGKTIRIVRLTEEAVIEVLRPEDDA